MRLRYSDGPTGRQVQIEITRHGGGRDQFYTFRIVEAGSRGHGGEYPFYLDAVRAALEAARAECRRPSH